MYVSSTLHTRMDRSIVYLLYFFFLQAEDCIRDLTVTGVQTCFFFFSSRRRHTRFDCDWSSDVCSSDLLHCEHLVLREARNPGLRQVYLEQRAYIDRPTRRAIPDAAGRCRVGQRLSVQEIGRASCRERV